MNFFPGHFLNFIVCVDHEARKFSGFVMIKSKNAQGKTIDFASLSNDINRGGKKSGSLPQEIIDHTQKMASSTNFRSIIQSLPADSRHLAAPVIRKKIEELRPLGQDTQDLAKASKKELKNIFLTRYATISNTKAFIASLPDGIVPDGACTGLPNALPSFSSDGRYFRRVNSDRYLKVTDLFSNPPRTKFISLKPRKGFGDEHRDAPVFSEDGKFAALTIGRDCFLTSGDTLQNLFMVKNVGILPRARIFSPDSKYFVCAGFKLFIFAISGDQMSRIDLGHLDHNPSFYPLSFSADGRYFFMRERFSSRFLMLDLPEGAKETYLPESLGTFLSVLPKDVWIATSSLNEQNNHYKINIIDIKNQATVVFQLSTDHDNGVFAVSPDGRFAIHHSGRLHQHIASQNLPSARLDLWDLTLPADEQKLNIDLPLTNKTSFSANSRYLLARTASQEPVYFDLHEDLKNPVSLLNRTLHKADLDLNPYASFVPETNRIVLMSKDYLRIVDVWPSGRQEMPLWLSTAGRAALEENKDPQMIKFLRKPNTIADSLMDGPIIPPSMSKDGCFLITTHAQVHKIWDIEEDILTR